ncbi:MAG: hypothetical protein RI894_2054, partial [Bacteroidota bacterium]
MIKLLHTLADTYKAICFLAVCLLASNILSAQTAAVTDATICNGQTAMITASGGALYHWNTGATTAIISVSPSTTTTYTVTITTGGSSVTLRSLVTVNPNPTAIITGDGLICGVGSTTVLTGTGGGTYLWSTGESTTSITVNHSDIYSVTVTNSYGCTATSDIDVEWSPIPTVRIDGVNSSICSGSSTDLTLTTVNATAFFWSNGASTPNITVSPTTATTYTVTVYSPKGCSATASCTITPHPCASVGDFVWFDGARGNPNNVQDTGEPGISNAVVSLY